ncbi:MAG: hypothetical protein KDK91_19485 [Gammaproteobacteria bacterium]|nr:hypothetical protein [Gammaproteobacteria bacterium]
MSTGVAAQVSSDLQLRLARDLPEATATRSVSDPGAPDSLAPPRQSLLQPDQELIGFGRSDMQRRLAQARFRAGLLEQEQRGLDEAVQSREALLQRLTQLTQAQSHTLDLARTQLLVHTRPGGADVATARPSPAGGETRGTTAMPSAAGRSATSPSGSGRSTRLPADDRNAASGSEVLSAPTGNTLLGDLQRHLANAGSALLPVLPWLLGAALVVLGGVLIVRRRRGRWQVASKTEMDTRRAPSRDAPHLAVDGEPMRTVKPSAAAVAAKANLVAQRRGPAASSAAITAAGVAATASTSPSDGVMPGAPGSEPRHSAAPEPTVEAIAGGDSADAGDSAAASGESIDAAVREVDTLIAFERFEQAERIINEHLARDPDNPEMRIRQLHIRSMSGDEARAREEQAILQAMLNGSIGTSSAAQIADDSRADDMPDAAVGHVSIDSSEALIAGTNAMDAAFDAELDELLGSSGEVARGGGDDADEAYEILLDSDEPQTLSGMRRLTEDSPLDEEIVLDTILLDLGRGDDEHDDASFDPLRTDVIEFEDETEDPGVAPLMSSRRERSGRAS